MKRSKDRDELRYFLNDIQSDSQQGISKTLEDSYAHQIILTLIANFSVHGVLLFIMTALNKKLMFGFAVNDFPLLYKVNPLVISMGQFFFSSLFLFPFCSKIFFERIQLNIGAIMLASISYIATITSSLTIYYFFNPPPYFQLRSFSISCAFFIGFFNKHFYNFPDTFIAVSLMICGTLLSSGQSQEYYFPYLLFGFASSIASVQYPFSLRKAINFFRGQFILMAFSLNICSLIIIAPFAITFSDFSIFRHPDFSFWPFLGTLCLSGFNSGILCLTSSLLIYFASPLHYVVFSTARQSLLILFQSFYDPIHRTQTPATFTGHVLCLFSAIMVMVFHFQNLKNSTTPWSFPSSVWRLLGLIQ